MKHPLSVVIPAHNEEQYIGGGTHFRLERFSIGIFFSLLAIVPYVLTRAVSGGMFWFLRESFGAIDGFDETLVSVEDISKVQTDVLPMLFTTTLSGKAKHPI